MLATCVTGDTGARSSAMSPPMRRHAWAHISALATSALDAVREEAHAALLQQPAVRTGREEDFQGAGTGRHATNFHDARAGWLPAEDPAADSRAGRRQVRHGAAARPAVSVQKQTTSDGGAVSGRRRQRRPKGRTPPRFRR